jgi:hypothetical protein
VLAAADPDRAERLAQSITSEMKACALAVAADAMAVTDPQQAARLSADAEHVAQSMADDRGKPVVLGFLAQILAVADPDRAERLAAYAERLVHLITDPNERTLALATIADILIHGEDRQMAPSITVLS